MSETYADLGGGVDSETSSLIRIPGHRHRFQMPSGWCSCGTRDDGEVCEYSPAWHATRKETA